MSARHSLLASSMMVKMRNLRPSCVRSSAKWNVDTCLGYSGRRSRFGWGKTDSHQEAADNFVNDSLQDRENDDTNPSEAIFMVDLSIWNTSRLSKVSFGPV